MAFEIVGKRRFAVAWVGTLISMACCMGLGALLLLALPVTFPTKNGDALLGLAGSVPTGKLFGTVALLVFGEEIVFRLVPVAIGIAVCKALRASRTPTMVLMAFVSSAAFAYVHGGWANLPIQGTAGLFLFVFFMRSGGVSGRLFRATAASYSLHFAFDAIALGIVVVGLRFVHP